jgi:NADH-quinone oxidoreductase subunit N
MPTFAGELWRGLLRDLPLVYPQLFLALAATLMLWPGDFFVAKSRKALWSTWTLGLLFLALILVLGPVARTGLDVRTGFSGMYRVDGVTVGFQLICIVAAMLTVVLSQPQLNALREQTVEYYALILFSLVGMLFLCGAADLITIYFSVELMALCIYVLVAYFREQERSLEAGIKYFLLGAFSSGILLYGISLLYAATGGTTTNLELLNEKLALATASQSLLVFGGVLMVLVGFAFKVAAVPFHMWSPDAYEGAPTPITAFMSMAPKAAALAAFLRVFGTGLHGVHGEWSAPLGFIAGASMVLGNVAALRQTSMKRLLAYSSIAHVGYMLLGVLSYDIQGGAQAIWLYMLTYLLMQTGAFAIVILLQGTGEGERIEDFSGLHKRHPVLAFAMLVFLLSLAGVPPLVGFFSKFYLFRLAIEQGYVFLTVLALLTSAVSAYYYLGVVKVMYFQEPVEGAPEPQQGAFGYLLGFFCFLTLVGTFFGPKLMDWVGKISWM